MIDTLINRSVDLFITNVSDLRCAPVQEILELLGHDCAVLGGRNLPRRNGHDADFLVGPDRPAQELLDGGLHARWQIGGLLSRDGLPGMSLLPLIVPRSAIHQLESAVRKP